VLVRWIVGTGEEAGPPYGIVFLTAFWLYVEATTSFQGADRREMVAIHGWHRVVFAAIGLYAATEQGVALAADLDVLRDSSIPAVRRALGIAGGLMLAVWGNFLPKLLSPWPTEDEPFDWQGVHRVVGWLASLGGVTVALVWLVLPIDRAVSTSSAIVIVALGLGLLFKIYSWWTHRPAGQTRAQR
jgi:hypothetical protein